MLMPCPYAPTGRAHLSLCTQVYASILREEGQAPALTRCFSHELCAGLVDKAKSLEEIASEEVCVYTCRVHGCCGNGQVEAMMMNLAISRPFANAGARGVRVQSRVYTFVACGMEHACQHSALPSLPDDA